MDVNSEHAKTLDDSECKKLETALTENVEPRKLAAYLCFHMGLTVAEASALRISDLDLKNGVLSVHNSLTRATQNSKRRFELAPMDSPRNLPMPSQVINFFKQNLELYPDSACFLVSGKPEVPGAHLLQNLLVSINSKYRIANSLSTFHLRGAFIRRCLENGIDLCTVGEYIGIKQLSELQKHFAEYLKPDFDAVALLDQAQPKIASHGKRMNLLILGAGSQGPVVKEIAEAIGVFNEIAYLDDNPNNKLAMDTCSNYRHYVNRFPIAIPSFGNCELRAEWTDRLEKAGYILPVLVHPMATISPSSRLSEAVVIEAKVIIGAGVSVERNCIISAGAVLDKGCTIQSNTHIGCACTITKDSVVSAFSRIPAGTVWANHN